MSDEIKKLSIDQWFLAKQLKQISKGFHLPFQIETDITDFIAHYKQQDKRPPFTALLIKAASLLIKERPEINGALFHTFYGKRFVSPKNNIVNLPLSLKLDGHSIVTGIGLKDAYQKSLQDISLEIKEKRPQSLNELPINRIIHGPGLSFIKKIKLSLIHFLFNHFPNLYLKKGGGGIAVSSLMNLAQEGAAITLTSYGMTTLTITACSLKHQEDKAFLCVGVSFEHSVTHGQVGTEAIIHFAKILERLSIDKL